MWRYTQVGRRGAPAKGVGRDTGARVQISLSPPVGGPYRISHFSLPKSYLFAPAIFGWTHLARTLFDINVSFLTASILVYFSRSAGSNCSCNFFVLKFCDCVYSRHLFCNGQTRRRRRRTLLTNTLTTMRGIPLLGDFPARPGLTKRLRNGSLYCLH